MTSASAPTVRTRRARGLFAGTPGRMRLIGVVTSAVLLLAALIGMAAVSQRSDALGRARQDAAQLVRLQAVRTNLVAADAAATNAFLVGGLEPAAARVAYEKGVDEASTTLAATASRAEGDDVTELGVVNRALSRYTGLIEAARANNRQGFPVGVAYLKQASTLLRDDVLPALTTLADRNARQSQDANDESVGAASLLWVGALLGLAAALAAQAWLTRRTRRWLSVPLVVAATTVVVASLLGATAMVWSQSRADEARTGAYTRVAALARARADAFDAKSAESLTLISRGSGEGFEERFRQSASAAGEALEATDPFNPVAAVELDAYLDVHRAVRDLDDGGDWDGAVALATSAAENGSNATFDAFADVSGQALDASADDVADELRKARAPLGAAQVLLLLAGIVAAAAVWQGFAIRLREYR